MKEHEKSEKEHERRLDTLREKIKQSQGSLQEKTDGVDQVKSKLKEFMKTNEEKSKSISTKEAQVEGLSSEKVAIYRRCKLEEINLPLTRSSISLSDVVLEDLEVHFNLKILVCLKS